MAIIFRDLDGYHWGYYSSTRPEGNIRMHLEVVAPLSRKRYKVFLEKRGSRCFEPSGDVPKNILEALEEVLDEDGRKVVETSWTAHMILMGNLKFHSDVDAGKGYLVAYPDSENTFVKTIDFTEHTSRAHQYSYGHYYLDAEDCCLILNSTGKDNERIHIDLLEALWRDSVS